MNAVRHIKYITLFCVYHSYSQSGINVAGIYKTKNDFINDSISYKVDLTLKDNTFENKVYFDDNIIAIKTPALDIKFKEKEIFGYTNAGKKYRYIKSESNYVELVERNNLIDIYKVIAYVKTFPFEYYYFSLNLNDEFIPLKKRKLIKKFKYSKTIVDNIKALNSIDTIGLNGHFLVLDAIK